ncbi:hypothetical protein [Georhizobium sp. MAB10]|uniref:hypothetical protein n=1 Tax=Georhizobium sp. MAB10 TaxID=3028319 RepID=UPI0038557F39
MKVSIYSRDHEPGLEVEWPELPRLGDFLVFSANGTEKAYEVEVVRWLLDPSGKQIGIELHLGLGREADGDDQGESTRPIDGNGNGSQASSGSMDGVSSTA